MAQGEEKAFPPGLDGLLQRVNESVLLVGALRAAAGADLFRHLATLPLDATAVAAACGLDERGARHLLAVLTSLGLLTCDKAGRYRCALPSVNHLERMLLLVDFLPETIRTGRPLVAGDTAALAGHFYAEGVRFLDVLYREATERCADHLARPGLRILELGAGTAVWSRAIARRQPDIHVTVVDLPPVVETTRRAVAGDDLVDRYSFVAADLFTGEWPADGRFDLVLVPNLCHLFGPEQNAWLLQRGARALRPGGRLAVIDVLADDHADASAALYALGLLTRTATGQTYPLETYAHWLRGAGMNEVRRHELGGRPPLSLMNARS